MKEPLSGEQQRLFCRCYLQTLDPQRAAEAVGREDGFALLRQQPIQKELERMRGVSRGQVLWEDAVRQLARLAFGRANDAVGLALSQGREADVQKLDLSALAELKVTDKGVEIKFTDRVRALEALCRLLDGGEPEGDANDFFQALEAAGVDG